MYEREAQNKDKVERHCCTAGYFLVINQGFGFAFCLWVCAKDCRQQKRHKKSVAEGRGGSFKRDLSKWFLHFFVSRRGQPKRSLGSFPLGVHAPPRDQIISPPPKLPPLCPSINRDTMNLLRDRTKTAQSSERKETIAKSSVEIVTQSGFSPHDETMRLGLQIEAANRRIKRQSGSLSSEDWIPRTSILKRNFSEYVGKFHHCQIIYW